MTTTYKYHSTLDKGDYKDECTKWDENPIPAGTYEYSINMEPISDDKGNSEEGRGWVTVEVRKQKANGNWHWDKVIDKHEVDEIADQPWSDSRKFFVPESTSDGCGRVRIITERKHAKRHRMKINFRFRLREPVEA